MLRFEDAPAQLQETVVLLDDHGEPRGAAPKHSVHGRDTPLHLGFSCYVFDPQGRVLVTRRAASKPTWPGVWSNACCGHPAPGEPLRDAVARRLRDELGISPRRMALAIPDFVYRAVMPNGVVEHELCPVVVAECDADPVLNPDEVADAAWLDWATLRVRAAREPATLSPWSVAQIARLGATPLAWLTAPAGDLDRPPATPARLPAPADDPVASVRRLVDAVLAPFLEERTAALTALDPALGEVAAEITALVGAGGKRLRPAYVRWGHRAAGGDDDTAVAAIAAAVEMLHTFALIHDDVMDRATIRRGQPAARTRFAEEHAAAGMAGDHERFGDNAAILAGDLAFVWADELLDTAGLDQAAASRVRRVFTTLRTEVMAGQYLELRQDGAAHPDAEAAQRIALLKSGRYTVTRPLQLGLAITGAPPATSAALVAYGDAIGTAFQLRDDVLGLFGDVATTGKSCTDDLRTGKRTLLVQRAVELVAPADREHLARCLGDAALTDDDAERCRHIVARSGALASVEALMRDQYDLATDAVRGLPAGVRDGLTALAALAVHRER
jgi:geranylgeranyl diphosphate synthase type I